MPKLQLSFHTTFALKKDDIQRILQVAQDENGLDSPNNELIGRTGLGNKKIGPMKSWTYRGGLINEHSLSSVGKIVWTHDRYLESSITDWLLHFFLSFGEYGLKSPPDDPAEWGGWTYFVYDFLPGRERFSLDDLVSESLWFFSETNRELLRTNFRYVLRAYTEKHALGALGWLRPIERGHFAAGPAHNPSLYFFAYALAKFWERDFKAEDSVSETNLLSQKMGLSTVLGVNKRTLQMTIDKLEACGLIAVDRNKLPMCITRCWNNPLELLEKAYTSEF